MSNQQYSNVKELAGAIILNLLVLRKLKEMIKFIFMEHKCDFSFNFNDGIRGGDGDRVPTC